MPLAGLALIPILMGAPPLLFPAHVVFLQLIISPVCSLVFEAEPSEGDAMTKPPRSDTASLFGPRQIAFGALQGVVILSGVLGFYVWMLAQAPETEARAAAFIALAIANMVLALTDSATSGVSLFDPHRRIFWLICASAVIVLGGCRCARQRRLGRPLAVDRSAGASHARPAAGSGARRGRLIRPVLDLPERRTAPRSG